MDTFDKLDNLLEKELDDIVSKGSMTHEELMSVDKIVDIMKDMKEICAMDEEEGYSQRGYYNGNSYRRGNSYRGSRNGGYARNNRGYSRREEREDILDRLDYLMENSGTEQERQKIREALKALENI